MIPPAGVPRPMHRFRHARTALLTLLGLALSLALGALLFFAAFGLAWFPPSSSFAVFGQVSAILAGAFVASLSLATLLRPPARWLFPAAMSLPFFLFTLFALSEPAAAARWLLATLGIFASGFIAALFAGYLRDRRAA